MAYFFLRTIRGVMPGRWVRRLPFLLITSSTALCAVGCWRDPGSVSPGRTAAGGGSLDPNVTIANSPVERMDDDRLRYLLDASASWRASRGPVRAVADQVVLVADLPSYFAALSDWNRHAFNPVLIDDPSWTLPFLRAFRPRRIFRLSVRPRSGGQNPYDEWVAAEQAVGRSWTDEASTSADPPPAGSPPQSLGKTPPGAVLSHPGSPSLAGAAALAAGRFQPLVRAEPTAVDELPEKSRAGRPDDVLTRDEALALARRIEKRVASVAREYDKLGDDVDFVTLAGDWPYRYRLAGHGIGSGDRAVDDLIGRVLPDKIADIDSARLRWAFAGRLIGDPAASAYRAMCSLFLQPDSCLLWNTYTGGSTWAEYDVAGASTVLRLVRPKAGAISDHSGTGADLAAWHKELGCLSPHGLSMINSSGGPEEFSIAGGPGFPADIPFGRPSVISIIHSFSAAEPTNPDTIAGRFLEKGAYIYYGSMNEPYLAAFRTPFLISQLIGAGTPLAAACRQGPYEVLGHPWRLVYLGDPLFQIEPVTSSPPRRVTTPAPPPGAIKLAVRDRPSASDHGGMVDWCYDSTLLALSAWESDGVMPMQPQDILAGLAEVDRERLDTARRARFDALTIDQSLAQGDAEGLLDRLLKIPARSRTPLIWHAIETMALDLVAHRLADGRFREILDLWFRVVVGPWPAESPFPDRLTQRVASAADASPPDRLAPFRGRLVEARDRLASMKILPERRDMLSRHLEDVDSRLNGRR